MTSKSTPLTKYTTWIVMTAMGIAVSVLFVVWKWQTEDDTKPVSVTEATRDASQSASAHRRLPPRADFVGSATCAECHVAIAQSYSGHSMAKSLHETTSASIIEDYSDHYSFSPDKHHSYLVERSPEGVFHYERLIDEHGEQIYDQAVRVDYAMGSGHQGRSYLIDQGGALFMSPITWYSHAARWDLSPQYKLPNHRRFERRIIEECLDCHSGRVNSVRGSNNHFEKPPFIELAIGCERCHGPGGEHASMHRQGPVERAHDPIINPAKLEPAQREDICAQCHLQGAGSFPRIGCEVGDFRPGQRLEETRVIFVTGTRTKPDGTTRAVSQVEQMRDSRCFQSSNGRFGCTSCHDPHSGIAPADIVLHYREKCLKCHTDKGCRLSVSERTARQADDSCIACHMPKLGANDVPHTSQTDHRVLRIADKPSKIQSSFGLPDFYDNAELRLPRLAVDYARGLWMAEQAEKKNDREMASRAFLLLSMVEPEVPDEARLLQALGRTSAIRGKLDDALDYWKKCLAINPDHDAVLESTSLLLLHQGRLDEARIPMERSLELQPWNSSLWARYAQLLAQSRDWSAAVIAAEKAKSIDPSVPQIYRFLAEAYERAGDVDQSRQYADLYRRIQQVRK